MAPSLDSAAVALIHRLRDSANHGNKTEGMQNLLLDAADRIETDAIKEANKEYCYSGCNKGSGGGGWPFIGGDIFG